MASPASVEIRFEDVYRTFGGAAPVTALRPSTFTIGQGELVGIVGRSGSGKSTLLNILGLLDQPTGGTYVIRGMDTSPLSETERTSLRSWHFGFVFQQFHLLNDRSASENVELGLLYRGSTRRDRRQRALKALERVGMLHRKDAFPATLSGGEKQRVAIARAISQLPNVLLCDEPTGNIDQTNSDRIIELLKDINGHGVTVIIVTHDQDIASRLPRLFTVLDGYITDSANESEQAGSRE
ncbi:MAG: ABC transporter ATP-binding protein [Acidimicrobiales bacterium]